MKILCIGRNYLAHARELNNEAPDEPVIFMKPDTSLLINNGDFYLPEFSQDIHHEVEVIYRVRREGKSIQPKFAMDYVDGIGIGIDFTARDLQTKLKEKKLPWTLAKGFNHAAPVSSFLLLNTIGDHKNISFKLEVNGETRQVGNTSNMIYPIEEIIAYISKFISLKKGDILFTGTPEGVGPVKRGDVLSAYLEDQKLLHFQVK